MDEHDQRQPDATDAESTREQARSQDEPESRTDRSVISTTDLVGETGRVDRPMPASPAPRSVSPPAGKPQAAPEREDAGEDPRKPAPTPPSPWRNTLIGAGVALAAGMIGAGITLYAFGPSKMEGSEQSSTAQAGSQNKSGTEKPSQSKSSAKASGSGAEETSQAGAAIPGFSREDDAETLRRQIEHLSERIDQLGHRMDTASHTREEVPPDLRTLQIKVGDLTKTIEEVGNLPSRYRRLESRLNDLEQEVKGFRDRLSSSREEGRGGTAERKATLAQAAPPPLIAISPPPTVESLPDAAWAEGVALFKSGRYSEANNVFRQLQSSRPTDARVWYYSALATGMTTGDWTGAAREQVEHGVKCERAGTPEKNQIVAAFTGLTEAQGRRWLEAYREKADAR